MIYGAWNRIMMALVVGCCLFSPLYAETKLSDIQEKKYDLISPVVTTEIWNEENKIKEKIVGRGIVTATQQIKSKVGLPASDNWVTYILTAQHTLTPDAIKRGIAQVTKPIFKDGKITGSAQTACKIVAVSDKYDLALLAIETKAEPFLPEVAIFVLSAQFENQMVYTSGPPLDGKRQVTLGKHLPGSHTFPYRGKTIDSSMVTTCLSRPGASGSGFFIIDTDGSFMCVGLLTHVVHTNAKGDGDAFGLTSNQILDFATTEKLDHAFQFKSLPARSTLSTSVASN